MPHGCFGSATAAVGGSSGGGSDGGDCRLRNNVFGQVHQPPWLFCDTEEAVSVISSSRSSNCPFLLTAAVC